MNKGAENMNVNVPNRLTLNILLGNTRNLIGGKFLGNSARDNNC
jgi:hypothetical protein